MNRMYDVAPVGKVFGRWIVIGFAVNKWVGVRFQYFWPCRCECGTERDVRASVLTGGKSISCGCLQREVATVAHTKHGRTKTPEYNTWTAMIKRCSNPKDRCWHLYGGRGIKVCKAWRNSFAEFLAHVGLKPSPSHSIDRIDNNGDYEPGNVRWATPKEQRANQRSAQELREA